MRVAGVAETVNHLDDGVHSGIKADRLVGGGDIVVDGAGKSDAGYAVVCKVGRTAEGSVSADSDDTVDSELLACTLSGENSRLLLELEASVRPEHRAAAGDDVVNRTVVKMNGTVKLLAVHYSLGMDKPLIALVDTDDLDSAGDRRACYRANCCVHTGGISARGKNPYLSEFSHYTVS